MLEKNRSQSLMLIEIIKNPHSCHIRVILMNTAETETAHQWIPPLPPARSFASKDLHLKIEWRFT